MFESFDLNPSAEPGLDRVLGGKQNRLEVPSNSCDQVGTEEKGEPQRGDYENKVDQVRDHE